MMKVTSGAFRKILDLLKQVPLYSGFPVVDADAVEITLAKTEEIINAQSETIRILEEQIRLREEDARNYPNLDYGILVAKDLLIRGLQMRIGEPLYIKSWGYDFGTFQKYREDARGGKGFFEIKITAEIKHSWVSSLIPQKTHLVYVHLHIACETDEHFWVPNHCGSYFCVDGNDCFEVRRDWNTGNIELGKINCESPVTEEFMKDATLYFPSMAVSAG